MNRTFVAGFGDPRPTTDRRPFILITNYGDSGQALLTTDRRP